MPAGVETGSERGAIDRYEAGAPALRSAIEGLSAAEMRAHTGPGAFSVAELVLHLLEADLAYSERMKRVIAMDRPRLLGWDQDAFARALGYEALDVVAAAELFERNRRMTATMLRAVPREVFAREGVLEGKKTTFGSGDGPVTLLRVVEIACEHLEHHMGFMRGKRERLGEREE